MSSHEASAPTDQQSTDRPAKKRAKFTRTRGVGCETCRRRKKKCAGIDAIFKTCLGCRKNGLLCLPWGSEHPHYPGNEAQNTGRSGSLVSHERGERSGTPVNLQWELPSRSVPPPPTAVLNHQPVQNFNPPQSVATEISLPPAQAAPLPISQADPDYDPQATYPGLDEPMSPNTAAIWMALIQYTEPDAHMAQTSGQAMLGQNETGQHQMPYPNAQGNGYGMMALDPRTDLRKHPHTQQLLNLYLEIADCWLPTFAPGSNNPMRAAVDSLHNSPASVCVRSALASAYIRCVKPEDRRDRGGREPLPRPLTVDLERLFMDTGISSISANPPDLSLSNKLWCIIDLQLYYFTHSSAFQGMEVMKMAADIIHQEFGETPELVVSLLYRQQTFGARTFALGDISRCLLDRGERCIFDLIGKNDDDPHIPASMALGANDSNWISGNAWLGQPMSVALMIACIVDLVADIKDAEAEGVRWTEGFMDRAFAIEQRIRKKDFSRSVGDAGVGEPPIGVVLGDLWKATALTVLYQSVFNYGPLHPHLRQALAEMRRTLNIIFQYGFRSPPPSQLPHLFGYLSCPVFFAGTLAVTPEDRQWARRMMERLGPEQVWKDNLALLEGVWREMDDRGWPVDWYEYMVRNKLWAGFY
ncbi:hypothetical protein NCC49_004467 [Naganishia albida]|nr:hypothetical protein NCC49_004467 [Naganishia albida]